MNPSIVGEDLNHRPRDNAAGVQVGGSKRAKQFPSYLSFRRQGIAPTRGCIAVDRHLSEKLRELNPT